MKMRARCEPRQRLDAGRGRRHRLVMRLRDTARAEGFDHERTAEVTVAPRQRFVVDFGADHGGFVFANETAGRERN